MSGRVFRLDIPVHQAVQELLPWYASAQLSPDETRRVHEHLQGCAQCRHELEWEHGMRAEAAAEAGSLPAGVDIERAFAALMPALGPQERPATPTSAHDATDADAAPANPRRAAAKPADWDAAAAGSAVETHVTAPRRISWWGVKAANQSSWLRWAVAAQWLVIVALGALLLRPDETPAYRVLGAGAAAGGNMVVVFQPATSERELRHILQAQNARIVDGPTVTDAWLLNVPTDRHAQILQALRANAAVKLAEPLDGDTAP
ncbi:hypothetical protein GTP55_17425 [Duganella sp. FT109W]|uniref:Putative zinc-finger domain-containing protein n=1 Tax=Duganella margarita TaxID=2692170 RepID=A0ABW9WLJ0_9BURK|nr:zf-HC2 domain-containing protein [Duganella margarita]MYN41147.1 hypothetical protein [Duganella margarita]